MKICSRVSFSISHKGQKVSIEFFRRFSSKQAVPDYKPFKFKKEKKFLSTEKEIALPNFIL